MKQYLLVLFLSYVLFPWGMIAAPKERLDGINSGWQFWTEGQSQKQMVDLPHDAMLCQERDPEIKNGDASGFYPGGLYHYEKTIKVPKSWLREHVVLHFGGVYRKSEIFVNGVKAGGCLNGFIPFSVCLDGLLHVGENTIRVDADNSEVPNCRWYTGGGIYRDIELTVQKRAHIEEVKVSTVSISLPTINVNTSHVGGNVHVVIKRNGKRVASSSGDDTVIEIPEAELWSAGSPNLYTAEVSLRKGLRVCDTRTVEFGIREIKYSTDGMTINGEPLLLKGGAIHSDNGVLGACDYEDAALRRISILKSYGFNAIRSAHNTASESILSACDRLGMYVMDESFDGWFLPKNEFDYSESFMDNYLDDVSAIVGKDYNHPSVIMYSIGNEISEPVLPGGMDVARNMIDQFHLLDPGRIVTGGINIMILNGTAKGNGLYYKDEDAGETETASSYSNLDISAMTSQQFNELMSKLNSLVYRSVLTDFADSVSTPILDALDIAGYNYASLRYPIDGQKHPRRVIVGSETFPQDVAKNWRDCQKYPYLVGDFMWAAWDYIGEAGIGSWAYGDSELGLAKPYPWLLADIGVLDILGNPTGEAFLVKALWNEGYMQPLIAVRPVREDVPVRSSWRGTNSIPSWGWSGKDGIIATIEVYSNAPSVELLLDGKSLGEKNTEDCLAVWEIPYTRGKLEAVSIYGDRKLVSSLESPVGGLRLHAQIEEIGDLVYVPISIVGENGALESMMDKSVTIDVKGGKLLGFGSACPVTEDSFVDSSAITYYGKALAVIKKGKGPLEVTLSAPGMDSVTLR